MPRRELATWIAERAWPSVVDHTEGNKPYFKSQERPGFQRHLLAFSGRPGGGAEGQGVRVLRRAMALVGEQYTGRLCAIFADDARERGVMGGLRLPSPRASAIVHAPAQADADRAGGDESLGGYAAPSSGEKPLLRLIVSQSKSSKSTSTNRRRKLLKFAFDDEDGRLSAALRPAASEAGDDKDGGEAFEAAAMASRDVILDWLELVSAGKIESF